MTPSASSESLAWQFWLGMLTQNPHRAWLPSLQTVLAQLVDRTGFDPVTATLGLAAMSLGALLTAAPSFWTDSVLDAYTLRVLRFTVLQAALSTVLSVIFALPVARALARRSNFWGRTVIVRLMGLPLVLPVIVAVFGIAAVWGQNGTIH